MGRRLFEGDEIAGIWSVRKKKISEGVGRGCLKCAIE